MEKTRIKLNKGFAAMLMVILILAIMAGIGANLISLTVGEQKIFRQATQSEQSYYAAESGIEDAILRIRNGDNLPSSYGFQVGDSWVTTSVSSVIGGTKTIVAQGDAYNDIRKVQATYQISSNNVSFYYGAQVGAGGMIMGNGSEVLGNLFSDGSVTGGGTITNDIIVAGNGNKIDGLTVGGNASAFSCADSNIGGNLTYVSGGSIANCTTGGSTSTQPNQINSVGLPISQTQITSWENTAAAGGIVSSDVTYSGILSAGPEQIGTPADPKNLTLANNTVLTIKGTIYVTGNIIFGNDSVIKLDPSYSTLGGIIIADGTIMVDNGVILGGSGQSGSYILVISNSDSLSSSDPAIYVKNTAIGAIFYANSGLIYLNNNMDAREITGYEVQLNNNAVIQYDSGLENASFSGGTGGSWELTGWKEIE